MTLARDEKIGLAIAGVVAAAALATFAYRQTWSTGPTGSRGAEPPPAPEVIDDQEARDDFASDLAAAFAADGNTAEVTADGTTLRVKWEMCSKQMLHRLLHDDQNFQVKNVREASGLSVKKLRSHQFKRVECDDGRKGLEPAVIKL